MRTNIVPMTQELEKVIPGLVALRTMSADEFVETHASGTLRKNKRLGMAWQDQYLHERIAYEFGWEFESLPQSRLLMGTPYTEGDQSAITEAGWHIERYVTRKIFPEDKFSAQYLHAEYPDGSRKEGIGIFVEETSAPWIRKGHSIFALISEYNTQQQRWEKANNPF